MVAVRVPFCEAMRFVAECMHLMQLLFFRMLELPLVFHFQDAKTPSKSPKSPKYPRAPLQPSPALATPSPRNSQVTPSVFKIHTPSKARTTPLGNKYTSLVDWVCGEIAFIM